MKALSLYRQRVKQIIYLIINCIMKNIKDSLFEWRKHLMMTLFSAILFALPIIILFLPSGYIFRSDEGDYEIYKWFIFAFIAASTIGNNILSSRCENYEQTIEKMNDEIELLKNEVKSLKNKDNKDL